MSTQIQISSSSSSTLTVGTTPSTGVDTRVFFQAGGVLQQSARFTFDNTTATNILQLGSGANLGVSLRTIAPGATVGDIAFRIRNSADTGDLASLAGDGSIAIGLSASTNPGNGIPIAMGSGSSANGNSVAIGRNTRSGFNSGVGYSNVAIGHNASAPGDSPGFGKFCVAIGPNTLVDSQADHTIAIGSSLSTANYTANIFYGRFINGVSFTNSAFAFGSGASDSSRASADIGNSFSIYINQNTRALFLNQKSNLVFKNGQSLASGTDFGALATNTLTIHNGTAPVTTIANAGQLYVEAGALRYRDGNGTITNAGGTVQSVASAATVTPVATNKLVKITAQAVGLTLAVPTGTIADGQDLMIRIKDSGSAQPITWTSGAGGYRAIGVTLPTTTTAGKTTYVGLIYNSDDSRWDAIGVTTEV